MLTMNPYNVLLIDKSEPSDIVICLQEIGISGFHIEPQLDPSLDFASIDLIIFDISCVSDEFNFFDLEDAQRPTLVIVGDSSDKELCFSYLDKGVNEVLIRPFDVLEAKLRISNLLKNRAKSGVRLLPAEKLDTDRYQILLDLSPDIILTVCHGVITYANKTAKNLLDLPSDTVVGTRLNQIIDNDYIDFVEETLPELADSDEQMPVLFLGKNGSRIDTLVSTAPIENEPANSYLIQARDHSEHKSAIESVLLRERRYKSLIEMSSNLFIVISDGVIIYVNPISLQKLQPEINEDTLTGRPFISIVDTDYIHIVDNNMDVLAEEDENFPIKMLALDGSSLDSVLHVRKLDSDLSETYLLEISDISEQKRSAEALLEREEHLVGIVDNTPDAIISIDEMGVIESFNNAATNIFDYSSEEALHKSLFDLI